MTHKIIHGYTQDDPMLQQLIFEGVNEMVQDATYPSTGLDFLVTEQDRVLYAVNEADGDIVGVLCYHITDNKFAEITLIYVEPSSRRRKLASSMISMLNTVLGKLGIHRKVTSVHATNAVAKAVLDKLGFADEIIRMEARSS